MAEAGYGCVFGDCTQQVAHIITDLTNGASVSLCDEHYAPGLIPILGSLLGLDPTDFYSQVERILDREAKKAAKVLADAQAKIAAEGSQDPAAPESDGRETFHDVGRDLKAERKHGNTPDEVPA